MLWGVKKLEMVLMGKRETELFLSPLPYLYQFDPFCFKITFKNFKFIWKDIILKIVSTWLNVVVELVLDTSVYVSLQM